MSLPAKLCKLIEAKEQKKQYQLAVLVVEERVLSQRKIAAQRAQQRQLLTALRGNEQKNLFQ